MQCSSKQTWLLPFVTCTLLVLPCFVTRFTFQNLNAVKLVSYRMHSVAHRGTMLSVRFPSCSRELCESPYPNVVAIVRADPKTLAGSARWSCEDHREIAAATDPRIQEMVWWWRLQSVEGTTLASVRVWRLFLPSAQCEQDRTFSVRGLGLPEK